MKAEIKVKIPKGWVLVRRGGKIKEGDRFLNPWRRTWEEPLDDWINCPTGSSNWYIRRAQKGRKK